MAKYIDIKPAVFFKGIGYTVGMFFHWWDHVFIDTDPEGSAKEFFYQLSGRYFRWIND
jgi:hypothetical protein